MSTKLFIKHRINTLQELATVQPHWGVEVDVRSSLSQPRLLHLSHEPWVRGEDFQKWLLAFKEQGIQGPLIVNTKEDGLEESIVDLLKQHKIDNYFFLDTAIPTLVHWSVKARNRHFAVRVSTYENIANALRFERLVDWVWIDCFDGEPFTPDLLKPLEGRFQLCLVSPELQKQPLDAIIKFKPLGNLCDAICTKRPDLWL